MKNLVLALGIAGTMLVACQTGPGLARTSFDELPGNVQMVVKEQIGDAEIVDIHRDRLTGNWVYNITYLSGEKEAELQIREDGSILAKSDAEIEEAAGAESSSSK